MATAQVRRVVITGLGVVSPLGVGVANVWPRLLVGETGVTRLRDSERSEYARVPCKVASYVPHGEAPGEFNIEDVCKKGDERKLSLATIYSLAASDEAMRDAGLLSRPLTEDDRLRFGVAIGHCSADLDYVCDQAQLLTSSPPKRLSPYFIPRLLLNLAAGHVSIRHGLKGPCHTASTACTTGSHAIGDAAVFIRRSAANLMLCGSCESDISPLMVAGFSSMRALTSRHNHHPHLASRPFDRDRDGFVMGEGAGVLVLEELEHALKRGARIYGEILGYGASADAYHVSAPSPDGAGAARSMEAAILDAGIRAEDVTYINAHATSTPQGDEIECKALRKVFTTAHLRDNVHVSSNKGSLGHLLGAAGSVESIFTTLACHHSQLPPNVNLSHQDEECVGLKMVPEVSVPWNLPPGQERRVALKNSFGFGGTNATLCISSYVD